MRIKPSSSSNDLNSTDFIVKATASPEITIQNTLRQRFIKLEEEITSASINEQQISQPKKLRIKSVLRTIAKFFYRLTLPLIRPIAWRGRQYLIKPILDDLAIKLAESQQNLLRTENNLYEKFWNALSQLNNTLEQQNNKIDLLQKEIRSLRTAENAYNHLLKMHTEPKNQIQAEKGVIVVGAGGHAKVVIEILTANGISVSYCIGSSKDPKTCCGVPVLVGDEQLSTLKQKGYSKIIIAIGDNLLRKKLADQVKLLGYELINAISSFAIVSDSITLGKGIAIMAGVIINAETKIGDLAIINTGSTIDHDCQIGEAAHIAPQCALTGNIQVGNFSFLGVGCKVIPGVKIGDKTIIGAGSLVLNDIPAGSKAYGVPTKIVETQT